MSRRLIALVQRKLEVAREEGRREGYGGRRDKRRETDVF